MDNPLDVFPKHKVLVRREDHNLSGHALAVGYICIAYGRMENAINHILQRLLGCSDDSCRSIVDATGARLETRLELIRKLALTVEVWPEWLPCLELVFTSIQKDLGPRRNRIVHDPWSIEWGDDDGYSPGQTDSRVFRKRAQSHQNQHLTPRIGVERTLDDLWKFYVEIEETSADIWCLSHALRNALLGYKLPEQILQPILARIPIDQRPHPSTGQILPPQRPPEE